MSTVTPVEVSPGEGGIPPLPIWRLSVEKYHQMIRDGVISENDRVELLDGWLVEKMTSNPPHRTAVELTRDCLEAVVPEGWHVDSQGPITLATSEPEPDAAVVRGRRRDYADHHPGPADVGLVIEVADATLASDRVIKKRAYAAAGIPVYWILNLIDRRLEVFTGSSGAAPIPGFVSEQILGPDEEVPVVLDGQEVGRIMVSDMLP